MRQAYDYWQNQPDCYPTCALGRLTGMGPCCWAHSPSTPPRPPLTPRSGRTQTVRCGVFSHSLVFLYRFTPDDGPSPPLSRKGRRPRPSGAPRFGFGRTLLSFVPAQQLALFPFIESRSLTKHATVHRGVPFAGGFLVYQPSTATSRRTGSCWLLSLKALSVTVPLCAVRVPTP